MAAKQTTPEQAQAFHNSQGYIACFGGCCLHEAIKRAEKAESKVDLMRRQLCSCGFTDFDEPSAHHLECNYRVTIVVGLADEKMNQLIDEVGEAGGVRDERR